MNYFEDQEVHRIGKRGDYAEMKKRFLMSWLIVAFLLSSCLGHGKAGKLKLERSRDGVTIDSLAEKWEEYDIYYDGDSEMRPTAVLFDPRADDKHLIARKWVKVEDPGQLGNLISWLESRGKIFVKVYGIAGPDDQIYGYMYSKRKDLRIMALDASTLLMDNFTTSTSFANF
jgi:hypothetical protein